MSINLFNQHRVITENEKSSCWRNCGYCLYRKFFFYLRPVLVFYSGIVIACCLSMCPCVHPCVSSKLVRTITCHTFKLDSPNLDPNRKNTLAKIAIVLGGSFTLNFKVKSNWKSKCIPFCASPGDKSPLTEAKTNKLGWTIKNLDSGRYSLGFIDRNLCRQNLLKSLNFIEPRFRHQTVALFTFRTRCVRLCSSAMLCHILI